MFSNTKLGNLLLEKVWLTYGKGCRGRFSQGPANEVFYLVDPAMFNETRISKCGRQHARNGRDTRVCTIDMHILMADESLLRIDWHTASDLTTNLTGPDRPNKLLGRERGAICEKPG
jgi:hypothetical protein